MFEKEEELLNESKERLERIPVPDELVTVAIQEGYLKARHKKRKRQRISWAVSIAAVLMLTFVTSIRVSPTFASAVANIPWLEPFVEMIQLDKGLEEAIENEYYESIGISQSKDGYTFTLDGVIVDETGAEIFYSLKEPEGEGSSNLEKIMFKNGSEDLLKTSSYGYDHRTEENSSNKISVNFKEEKKLASKEFTLDITLDNTKKTGFTIPFTLKNDIKEGKVYAINEEVEIDGQKIKIKEVTVNPLRVGITIQINPQNEMEIMTIENMRLEDENGETWGSVKNGVTAFGGSQDKERTFFLQSNYFREPKELYLKIDKVQALPKEESYLLVDLEKQEVLNKMVNDKVEILKVTSNELEYQIDSTEDFNYTLFSSGIDAQGNTVDIPSSSTVYKDDYVTVGTVYFETKNIVNPIKLPFSYYPNYLEESASVRIK